MYAGRVRFTREPSPSWPQLSRPQQNASPSAVTAHVSSAPVAIATNRSDVFTALGTSRLTRVPSPSWPPKLLSQQNVSPRSVTPHAWVAPVAVDRNVWPPATPGGPDGR